MIKLPSVLTACMATESAVHVHKTPLTVLGLFSQSRSVKKKTLSEPQNHHSSLKFCALGLDLAKAICTHIF